MSLRWQIAVALAAIAATVGTAAGLGSYLTTEHELQRSVDQSLATVADRIRGDYGLNGRGPDGSGRGGFDDRHNGCPNPGDLAPAADVQIRAGTKVTVCQSSSDGALPAPTADHAGLRIVDKDGTEYRALVTVAADGRTVQVARDLSETDDVLARLRLRLVALVVAGVATALAAGWLLARRIARPIVGLRDTAETIARTQDLDTPIPTKGAGEVASLGRSFGAMVAALSTSRTQQRHLVDNASHEMRTPLTSLTTNLEHLEHFAQLPSTERQEVLDAVQLDVAELANLLTELVQLATDRVDDEEPEPLLLADVVRDVAQRSARRTGRTITVSGSSTVPVSARPHLLERAVANLLDNAVKYSPAPDPIKVTVDDGRVEVRDHGPGIDPADRPQVFDRFYRATSARTEPGSGLGLAIVREIVERHGGTAWVSDPVDGLGGAIVGFELPTNA